MRDNPRIVRDNDGTLDDFYAENVESVHFEAIDENRWYAVVRFPGGEEWMLDFGAKNPLAKGYASAEFIFQPAEGMQGAIAALARGTR